MHSYPVPEGILAIVSDITERKKAEDELVLLSNAVKMSIDSILIMDLDTNILDVNEATLKMYGAGDKNELIGKFEVYKRDKKAGKNVGWKPKLKFTKSPFPQQVDYCMAFVESGIDYLKKNGKLGFVISSKITCALYANLLRRFLIEKTSIIEIVDHSICGKQFFEGATNSPLVLILSKSAPNPNQTKVTFNAFKSMTWKIQQNKLQLITKDPESPWQFAPPEVTAIFEKAKKKSVRLGDVFSVHMGVKTSLNNVYLVKSFVTTASKGMLTITNSQGDKANIEEELLKPVVRGRDIEAWHFENPGYILWTHDNWGKPLSVLPNQATQYFAKYKKKLLTRTDYKKKQPIWIIFRVSKDKLGPKVGWQELSKMMEAVVIEREVTDSKFGKQLLIPLQTVYFVSTGSINLDYGLAAVLNSSLIRAFISSFSIREMGQPPRFRHVSYTVGLVPIPSQFIKQEKDSSILEIIEMSRAMHANKGQNRKLAKDLDRKIAKLYGLSSKELSNLNQYLYNLGVPTIHDVSLEN